MNRKRKPCFLPAVMGAALAAGAATVSDINILQDAVTREVTITYSLSGAPAIVTLDIQTNGPSGYASIGGEHIDCFSSDSDVWRKVSTDGTCTIKWHPDQSWPGGKATEVKAVVSAWSSDNPPDYMVADISSSAAANTERYYPSVDFLPGGLLGNPAYRTTKLVMRKVMATGIPWTMGTGDNSTSVTLTNNYYIGVFEMTQGQFYQIAGYDKSAFKTEGAMRPANLVYFNELRCASGNTSAWAGGNWPNPPYAGSFLDKLRRRTGLDFDLPGEAQWEYACRAGHSVSEWGNGVPIGDGSEMPGRHRYNGGFFEGATSWPSTGTTGPTNGLAIVGSYAPNSWGLYDMHGNVFEMCVDWFESSIAALNGRVNVDPENPANTLGGNVVGTKRVRRGGSWHVGASESKSTNRLDMDPAARSECWGFRVICHAGNAATHASSSSGENAAPVALTAGIYPASASVQPLEARSFSISASDVGEIDTFPAKGMYIIFR